MKKGNKVIQIAENTVSKTTSALSAKGGLLLSIIVAVAFLGFSAFGGAFDKGQNNNKTATSAQNIINKKLNLDSAVFKFKDIENTPIDFSGVKGTKNIILYSFKTSCIECRNEISFIERSIPDDQKSSFLIVLLSSESSDALKIFKEKVIKTNLNLVSDVNSKIHQELNISPTDINPTTYIWNKNQEQTYISFGYNDLNNLKNRIQSLYQNVVYTSQKTTVNGIDFIIDPPKLQNGCVISKEQGSVSTFKSDPKIISAVDLKKNIASDDLANCIDTIKPQYLNLKDADYVKSDDIVFTVKINNNIGIYPRKILIYHPYLEDKIDSLPIGIMYDSLTDTINVFSRIINNKELNFIYSGRVYNNHYLLLDTTYFNLYNGKQAVSGQIAGYTLDQIPVGKSLFKNVMSLSDALVVSKPSQLVDYDTDPLASNDKSTDYRSNDTIIYPIDKIETKFARKDEVIRIEDQILNIKDLKLPYSGKTKSGINFLINVDSTNSLRVYDRKLGDKIYVFDNKTGVITETEEPNPKIKKKVDYKSSQWSVDMVAIDGPLKDNRLKELVSQRGYYFYVQQ